MGPSKPVLSAPKQFIKSIWKKAREKCLRVRYYVEKIIPTSPVSYNQFVKAYQVFLEWISIWNQLSIQLTNQ